MIKKLKIGLLVIALVLLAGVGSAYAADLIYSVDTTVTIGSANYTITSGSSATSTAVGASSITVVVPDNVFFTFKSANRYVLNSDYGASDCSSSENSLSIGRSGTYTITPDTTATCTSGGGGGGGGGGGSVSAPATPAVAATPAVPAVQIEGCVAGNLFSTTSGASCTTSATPAVSATPATSATSATPAISASASATTGSYNLGTATLKNGSRGEAVKELQRFLNDKLNLGLVPDGILGPKTITVVKQWQSDNGLVADGLIGPATKAMMNAGTSATPASASATTGSYNLGTATLKNGSRGEAVKELQRFLNDKLNLGLVPDGILGPKTIAVIKQWQEDNGLVADGLIGPKTKGLINSSAQ